MRSPSMRPRKPARPRIERVWLDTTRPKSGGSATLSVALRGPKGDEILKRVPITFPANVTGSVQLLVADGARASADDRRELRGADLQRPAQIIRTFNRTRRGNRLYVRLSTNDPGAVVSGEPMAALPPSVLGVLDIGPQHRQRLHDAIGPQGRVGRAAGSRPSPVRDS